MLEIGRILAIALLGEGSGSWGKLGIHTDGVWVECHALLQVLEQIQFRLEGKDLRIRPPVQILLRFIVSERHRGKVVFVLDLGFLILQSLLCWSGVFDILKCTHSLNIDQLFGPACLFELRYLADGLFLLN